MATATKNRIQKIEREIQEIWKTVNEVMPFLPHDDLGDYANPERIKRSYQKAIKKHPPIAHGGNQNQRL